MARTPGAKPQRWTWKQLCGAALLGIAVALVYLVFYTSEFQHTTARHQMVREQVAGANVPVEASIRDAAVLAALRSVPRHRFVPPSDVRRAYADQPLLIDEGTTISQPYIIAYMAELLRLDAGDRVLAINLGSGYEAAVLASIVREVYAVALTAAHSEQAGGLFAELGYTNIRLLHGDAYAGWAEHAPYDAIFVRAGVSEIPEAWREQLRDGGRMAVPLGSPETLQSLVLVEKQEDGSVSQTHTLQVRFMSLPPPE